MSILTGLSGLLHSDDYPVRPLKTQRTPVVVVSTYVLLPVLLLLAGTVVFTLVTDATLPYFLNEPQSIYKIPSHAGALSNVGVLLWCAAASVCLLTSLILHKLSGESDKKWFLLGAGVLTSALMLDDLFRIHEAFAPNYLGVSSTSVYAVYVVLTAFLVIRYRRVIYRSTYSLLGLSVALLGGSMALDLVFEFHLLGSGAGMRELHFLLEEGAKLLGIASWLGYFGWTCYTSLIRCNSSSEMPFASQTVRPKLDRRPVSIDRGRVNGHTERSYRLNS